MKSSIVDSIKSLPPLPKTIIEINTVFSNPDSSLNDLVKVIEHDPMIVANILKAANSPLYGFRKEINTPLQAVSLFGMSLTRTIALSNSLRKLLNVDMQPYGVSSERFAQISELQALLIINWYKKIDRQKADKLYMASFLQETGKIVIASDIIQEDMTISFFSEIELTNNVAQVEKSYVDVSSSEITAVVFEHWNFDKEFVSIIRYADNPSMAPDEVKEYSEALNIVKSIVPINKPFSEVSINIGLKKAENAGYDANLLKESIDDILANAEIDL